MAAGRVLAPPAPSAATRVADQSDEEHPGAAQLNGSDPGVLRLRWNSHVESLQELFESLLDQQLFVDVTLACDGGSLRAHRVMLSAVSSYFRRVLSETTSKCPVIIMRDVPASEMHFILQFIYRGEIHVPEDRLPSLLRTARLLEIRGLSDKLAGEDAASDKEKPAEVVNPVANGNGRIAGRGTRDSLFKTKRPTQLMVKEEDLDEDEDMESDCDVPDGRQKTTTGNGNHSVSEDRTSPLVPPLDLSNGASDEENEVPSCKKRSTRTKVSPIPALVKCEQAEEEMDEELEDEEELDEELLDEEEELEATTGHHHGGSSIGASYPFGLSASSTSGSSAATPTGAGGGGSGLVVQAVCPFCFKDCKRTAELRAHIRAHTGEKPFRCDICSAPFARSAHLKRHRRVHTGERPFECHRCQKTFSRQDKLKLHMDRHRLRDTGGSKMIVGRPKKLPGTGPNSKKSNNGPISDADLPGTSSSSSEMMNNGVNGSSSNMSGMGQFAFPGAPARPSSSQSSSSSASAPSSRSTPYGDLNYFSLLSLSQRGLTISSSPGSSPSGSSVPHLLSPQTLQELHLFQQRQHQQQQQQQQHRPGRPVRSTRSGGPHQSRHLRDSASETLLNFAQQVVEVVAAPSAAPTTQS